MAFGTHTCVPRPEEPDDTPISVNIQRERARGPLATIFIYPDGTSVLANQDRRYFESVGALCTYYGIEEENLSIALESKGYILL